MTNKEFTTKYGNFARSVVAGSGIFPETLLSQAILESRGGDSTLALKHNNFFGIKADANYKGARVLMNTREVINGKSVYVDRYFRKYTSPADSFRDYVKFLKTNPRYTKAGVFTAPDFQSQIKAIAAAGYATGTSYADTLIKIAQNVQKALTGLKTSIINTAKENDALIMVVLLVTAGVIFLYLNQ